MDDDGEICQVNFSDPLYLKHWSGPVAPLNVELNDFQRKMGYRFALRGVEAT